MAKKALVTGAAGFIGFYICKDLLESGYEVIGLDNINAYYDVNLKYARLAQLGIDKQAAAEFNAMSHSSHYGNRFGFVRMNLEDREALPELFKTHRFDVVINMAAQAGVRYSLENPMAYVDSNVVGFV